MATSVPEATHPGWRRPPRDHRSGHSPPLPSPADSSIPAGLRLPGGEVVVPLAAGLGDNADMSSFTVSFVCTGNICRSPMGEVILRDLLDREGLGDRVQVVSRSEEHTSELQSRGHSVCRLLHATKTKST